MQQDKKTHAIEEELRPYFKDIGLSIQLFNRVSDGSYILFFGSPSRPKSYAIAVDEKAFRFFQPAQPELETELAQLIDSATPSQHIRAAQQAYAEYQAARDRWLGELPALLSTLKANCLKLMNSLGET